MEQSEIIGMAAGEGGDVMASVLGSQIAERNAGFALAGLSEDALQRVIVKEAVHRFGGLAEAWLYSRALEAGALS
jgi:hypothetical protein